MRTRPAPVAARTVTSLAVLPLVEFCTWSIRTRAVRTVVFYQTMPALAPFQPVFFNASISASVSSGVPTLIRTQSLILGSSK